MREAGAADTGKVLATLSSAFRDDPVWSWVAPDPASRSTIQEALFAPSVEAAIVRGTLWVTNDVEAAAVYVPPGESETLYEVDPATGESVWAPGLGMLGEHAGVVSELFDLFERTRPSTPEHFYLSLLGTHEDHRGRGIGMALLRETLTLVDRQRRPAYLESTNPGNDARYRSVGFTDFGEFAVPRDGRRIRTMWRAPSEPTGG